MIDSVDDAPQDATDDLAFNQPGATLRQRSSEIRASHPVLVPLTKLFGIHTEERAWRRGAAGEEEVATRLNKLGDHWRVIHGVPVGDNGTDIDHVVIGPAGVFTLNTKNHLGKKVTVYEHAVYVSGMKQPYLAKSRAEGRRASRLLTIACGFDVVVSPVLVVMASDLIKKGTPRDVAVIGRRKIVDWLTHQPTILTADHVEAIYIVARQRTTWTG